MARNLHDVGRARRGILATPADGGALIPETAAIQIVTAGDVAVAFADAPTTSVSLGTFATVGQVLPYGIVRVFDTGTTADVLLLY